ncbi:MAG: hypothetical protein LBO72_07940 [Helicobacteraceae bacterium]|jgi:hypothetical protein|nr:hypothetical protein [Helicobacteraceae bacterium]
MERRESDAKSLAKETIDASKSFYKNWIKARIGDMRLDEIQYEYVRLYEA